MIKVNVEVNKKSWHKRINKPKKYFEGKIKKIYKIFPSFKNRTLTFSILLTSSLNMKKFNKKFRNINKATDVLSFPYMSYNKLESSKEKNIYIGDIAVSYEIINSRSKKKNFHSEFNKVWVHGFLHLMGYRHAKNKDYFKMRKIEKKIVNLIS